MTSVTPSTNVPNVATLENLNLWAIIALSQTTAGMSVRVRDAEAPAPFATYNIGVNPEGAYLFQGVIYVPLATNYETSGLKLFRNAREIATVSLPTAFTSL